MKAKGTDERLKIRSIKLREDQDEWVVEQAWRQRKSVSALMRDVVDWYKQQPPRKNQV